MAEVKITALPAYADPASTDVLPIVDVTADLTKKVSIDSLLKNAAAGTAAAPAFAFDADPDTGMYRSGADALAFSTGGTGRLFIDSSGNVGVGTASPSTNVEISRTGNNPHGLSLEATDVTNSPRLFFESTSTNNAPCLFGNDGSLVIHTGATPGSSSGSERLRIDSSGRLLVGTSTARNNWFSSTGYAGQLQIETTGWTSASITRNSASAAGPNIQFGKSRGTANGAVTVVADGDVLGRTSYFGGDGTGFIEGARIDAFVDGTPGTNDMPGRLVFSTTADGASSPTQRMRIQSSGNILANFDGSGQTGTFRIADGTAGAPGLSFWADGSADTGLFRPAANTLCVSTGGAERMRIDSSGNLLVGTSSSSSQSGTFGQSIRGSNPGLTFIGTETSGAIRTIYESAGNLIFWNGTSGAEIARFDSSGRLGIGASSPLAELHLVGTDSNGGTGTAESSFLITAGGNQQFRFLVDQTNKTCGIQSTEASVGNKPLLLNPSGGNVGIGTSSPTNGALVVEKVGFQLSLETGTSGDGRLNIGHFNDGAFIGTYGDDGGAADFIRFGTHSGDERMRIDSSGRVLVGTTSSIETNSQLQVVGSNVNGSIVIARNDTSVSNNQLIGRIQYYGNDDNGTYQLCAAIDAAADGDHATGDKPTRLVFSTTADGSSSPTERMRIDNLGGQSWFTSSTSNNGGAIIYAGRSAGTSYNFLEGRAGATGPLTGGTASFWIRTNGNIQNTNNSYGAISDAKLKENIVDASSQWDDIKDLRVRNYNFIEGQTHTQIGVVAQEVETVSPGLVAESPDFDEEGNDLGTVTKSVNYSVLYMKAVKALQEAMDRIETLESKVAALEAAN